MSHITPTLLTTPVHQQVDLATVPTPQLTQIKNQLTQELSDLTNSFAQLRAAQAKFRDCITSIRDGVVEKPEGSWFSTCYTLPQKKNREKKTSDLRLLFYS